MGPGPGVTDWVIERRVGPPTDHHASVHDPISRRIARVCEVTAPALVLGSTQGDALVDRAGCARLGLEVVRRRTGGGAVILRPGQVVWIDLAVPRSDPLWVDDVGRAAGWLGEVWAAALRGLGVDAAGAHQGDPVCSRWGRVCCFAGLDRNEVQVEGRKVVGVSQRRRRDGARFQTLVYLTPHDPAEVLDALVVAEADRVDLGDHLRHAVEVVDHGAAVVTDALLDALPR